MPAAVVLAPDVVLASDVVLAPDVVLASDVVLAPDVVLASDVVLAPGAVRVPAGAGAVAVGRVGGPSRSRSMSMAGSGSAVGAGRKSAGAAGDPARAVEDSEAAVRDSAVAGGEAGGVSGEPAAVGRSSGVVGRDSVEVRCAGATTPACGATVVVAVGESTVVPDGVSRSTVAVAVLLRGRGLGREPGGRPDDCRGPPDCGDVAYEPLGGEGCPGSGVAGRNEFSPVPGGTGAGRAAGSVAGLAQAAVRGSAALL